jgi:hypothetical protein
MKGNFKFVHICVFLLAVGYPSELFLAVGLNNRYGLSKRQYRGFGAWFSFLYPKNISSSDILQSAPYETTISHQKTDAVRKTKIYVRENSCLRS